MKFYLMFLSLFMFIIGCTNSNRKVSNLQTFAKVYGYVRWFYPGDEAAKIDWAKLAVYGVQKVENAKNEEELNQLLLSVFKPIAPAIRIEDERKATSFTLQSIAPADTAGMKPVTWKHYGVYLGKQSNIYSSIRLNRDTITDIYRPSGTDTSHTAKLGEFIRKEIGNHLILTMPLVLYSDKGHTYPVADPDSLKQLSDQLDRMPSASPPPRQLSKKPFSAGDLMPKLSVPAGPKSGTAEAQKEQFLGIDDSAVRLANVVIAWNVFQHFYPYFEVVKVDWEQELTNTLNDVYMGKSEVDYFKALSRMVAKLEDGHGAIFPQQLVQWGFPIMVSQIGNKIVVAATSETRMFQRGDIIQSIDGKAAADVLKEQEELISGSPQLRRYRALNLFGSDFKESKATVVVVRQGEKIKVQATRQVMCNQFFNPLFKDFEPVLTKLGDSIYYMNDYNWNTDETLKKLLGAKTIIINQLKDAHLFISHIIQQPVWSARWNVPISRYPDRKNVFWDTARWQVQPKEPYIKAKLIFLTHPYNVSSNETYLGIIDNYKLGKLVGDSTAGTNGNVNYIPLIGGYTIMWTGMKVLKHDGSQHHLIGFKPDYPVTHTMEAILEGRDEYIEKAKEILAKD
jgi:hypothetical protein